MSSVMTEILENVNFLNDDADADDDRAMTVSRRFLRKQPRKKRIIASIRAGTSRHDDVVLTLMI